MPVRLAAECEAWAAADKLAIDQFPWFKQGQRQATDVGLLYDDQAIYLLFVCEDKHINSVETRPNGDVYKDSCVEFFATPNPRENSSYFNFESNCCGCVHLGWGAGRHDRKLGSPQVHADIKVKTSIPTPTREESPRDDGWWLAAAIQFSAIEKLGGLKLAPRPGDTWRVNFFRCGGKTDGQYACWSPIDFKDPDFHRPQFFGLLKFE
jgi:hypothetical protein